LPVPDDGLHVLPLGVGDAFSERRDPTTFVLIAGGKFTLVDIPAPPRKVIREVSAAAGLVVSMDDVDDLILTHVHGDHCNGVECFGFYKLFVQKRKPRLWSIPEVTGPLWDHRLRAPMERLWNAEFTASRDLTLTDYFDVRTLAFGAVNAVNGLCVEIHPTRHHVPCFGMRVGFAGRRWGYSCDTTYLPELIEFLRPCDLIFHETNYGAHTPYARLAALPAELRAKMRLVHYPDDFDTAGSAIECAVPGRLYRV
jgi:ribonuclease BN (tRNA processing enzyme)